MDCLNQPKQAYGQATQRLVSVKYLFGRHEIPLYFPRWNFNSNFRDVGMPFVFEEVKKVVLGAWKRQLRFS